MFGPRGDVQHDTYYDYESKDDTVSDIIAEMDEACCVDTLENFNISMFDDPLGYLEM